MTDKTLPQVRSPYRAAAAVALTVFAVVAATIAIFFYNWKLGLVVLALDFVGALCVGMFFAIADDIKNDNNAKIKNGTHRARDDA